MPTNLKNKGQQGVFGVLKGRRKFTDHESRHLTKYHPEIIIELP